MSFVQKCKFIFRKDDERWEGVVQLLKEYNTNLCSLGPSRRFSRIEHRELEIIRDQNKNQLDSFLVAFQASAQQRVAFTRNSLKDHYFYQMAQFRAAVMSDDRRQPLRKFTQKDFKIAENYRLEGVGTSTMALMYKHPYAGDRRVVLIEWMDPRMDTDIFKAIASMLATPRPEQLLLPKCYGIVEGPEAFDTDHRPLGIVLKAPPHIGQDLPEHMMAGSISMHRMPISLKQRLEQDKHNSPTVILDLAIRFRLARKLVNAVHVMHLVGWVHK